MILPLNVLERRPNLGAKRLDLAMKGLALYRSKVPNSLHITRTKNGSSNTRSELIVQGTRERSCDVW